MKYNIKRIGAWAMAVAMLGASPAQATEMRLGDYIYVPAISTAQSVGQTKLRVTALMLGADSDEPVEGGTLAGAEFGVYVISSSGEVRPWANPLYPSEPMRIRTGEGETSFTLPDNMEFYLKQESAPQGYVFDSETLIPVTGEEIAVRNAMMGELLLRAEDSVGNPIAGVTMDVTGADGSVQQVITDAQGEAVVRAAGGDVLTVSETALGEDVKPAELVRCDGQEQNIEGQANAQVQATLREAARSRLTFVHPTPGSVQLKMQVVRVDENGEQVNEPLPGVRLTINAQEPMTGVTDETGVVEFSLLKGSYDVELAYEGELNVKLPLDRGQVIVENGTATVIALQATSTDGRIGVQLDCERKISGGEMTIENAQTGEVFGPYAFDEEGLAVTGELAEGEYRIASLTLPEGVQIGGAACDIATADEPQELAVNVSAGKLTSVEVKLMTLEKQRFAVMQRAIDERGEQTETALAGVDEFELIAEDGTSVGFLDAQDGSVDVEALSGTYRLRMAQDKAGALGLQSESNAFTLPTQAETIAFAGTQGRLILTSVDENGTAIAGAQYAITDAAGNRYTVTADDAGQAVSPLMSAGEAKIETITAPENHDAAQAASVQVAAGEAVYAEITHERYGRVQLNIGLQSLDEQGNAVVTPMENVGIRVFSVTGDEMTDTGISLSSDAGGAVTLSLAAGEYVAQIDAQTVDSTIRTAQSVRLTVENTMEIEQELVCMAAEGGVRAQITGGELTQQQLAQVRFELIAADGTVSDLTMHGGAFYAGGLSAGVYVLRQTQIPEGYTLAAERTLNVSGGTVTEVNVPLEEYAVVSVSKTGLTFTDDLRTYIVPLSGEYGIYTQEDGEMKPYPNAAEQMTVWANVTPEEIAQGRRAQAKLPAKVEGTTYYLKETGGAQGFAADEEYVELTLHAGETVRVERAVSSDRGFFTLAMTDAATGEPVTGGKFELIEAESGECAVAFTAEEAQYRNEMAIPVGDYVLRQTQAAQGYALAEMPEADVTIEPYLTQGGTMTDVAMSCLRLPEGEAIVGMEAELYAAEQQGLTLVTFDAGSMPAGETLSRAQTVIDVTADGGERVNIESVVLSGVGGAQGSGYRARVEYCLAGGGWQPSDARMTDVLTGPTAVSLSDVKDDVSAVRITYINEAGEEAAGSGFMPGQTAISVRVSTDARVSMTARASFGGTLAYRTAIEEAPMTMARSMALETKFDMQGGGAFETVSPGRDGRISGVAFFDVDGDGVMDADESGRYAGMNVILMDGSGNIVETARTGSDGRYMFDALPSGTYSAQFDAGDALVYSHSDLYSAHMTSGVTDSRTGMSDAIAIDGDHTDVLVNAGCIYAAKASGAIRERLADGTVTGRGGVGIELVAAGSEDEEPIVIMTDDSGEFCFMGLLPGAYTASIVLPEGYLCAQLDAGEIRTEFELEQGGEAVMGEIIVERSAAVRGTVRIDDDGDGVIGENAQTLAGVSVALLRARDGHTEEVARTQTGADGAYAFDNLYPGEYSVLFELADGWTFTKYGEDSLVYGAVSGSGSTRGFTLVPGQPQDGIDAGVTLSAQLTVTVFKDTQYNGQMGAYEELFGGVSVSLIRLEGGEDAEMISYRTDEQGTVVFGGISPGEYVIAYQLPGQWRATKQVSAQTASAPVSNVPASMVSSGRSMPFTLSMGQNVRMYIGAMLSGTISGRAYYDDNADAQYGADESGVADVLAELLDAKGNVVTTTRTLEDGTYAFEGLAPGRYSVRFTAQEGACFSGTPRSMARGGVQASSGNVSATRAITVIAGEATATADAGIVRLATVMGDVWEDRNVNRTHDDGEPGIAGVSVNLMNGAGRSIISTVKTDANGRYAFTGLMPDDYLIRVDTPEGYVFSGAEAISALALERVEDGRGYSAAFTLKGGAAVTNAANFGMYTQGVIGGKVWNDENYDGMAAEAEDGLRGVKLTLIDAQGNVRETQTGRSGEFEFDKLTPGRYTLTVELTDGYVYTAEGGQSIVPRTDSRIVTLDLGELAMGQIMNSIAIGALKPASVGGVVWYDSDDDGRRKNSDGGVAGVGIVLTALTGADAGKTYATTTDETGAYSIAGVMPGDVQLTYTLPQGMAFARNAGGSRVSSVPMTDTQTASGNVFALRTGENNGEIDVGAVGVGVIDGAAWIDAQYDGVRGEESGLGGVVITLKDAASGNAVAQTMTDESGAYRIEFVRMGSYTLSAQLPDGMIFTRAGEGVLADTDAQSAQTGAFDIAMGASRTGMNIGAIHPASITGRIATDSNEDGVAAADEPGMPGVTVTAMEGGTVVATAQTGEDGSFAFTTLRPGTYRVRYTLPEDALFARGTALTMAGEDAQEGETGERALAMGEQAALDPVAAVHGASISGIAWLDTDVDGMPGGAEERIGGVVAQLLDANGQVIASYSMDNTGEYAFSRLRSGTYSLIFTLPEGMLLADCNGQEEGSCAAVVPGNVGSTEPFALAMGQSVTRNIGGIVPGEIGDTVFLDKNGNGLQDYREPLVFGAELVLLSIGADGTEQEAARVTSDQFGYYKFGALRPGTYVVKAELKDGDTLTFPFGEPMGEIDSDLDPETGRSEPILLRSGQTLRNVDVGYTEFSR